MGNYSWLLRILNCKDTIIDWETILKLYPNIWEHYRYSQKDIIKLKSLYDFSISLHDTKLFGYIDNNYCKLLCKISLHTSFTDKYNSKLFPRIYFEEEGWDRIHFLEFHCGTEEVIWGSYAFDFIYDKWGKRILYSQESEKNNINDHQEYPSIFENELDNKLKDTDQYFNSKYEDDYSTEKYSIDIDEDTHSLINAKHKEYVINLIYDKFTNWNISKLDYNKQESDKLNIHHLMNLVGIRNEDIVLDPEGSLKLLNLKGVTQNDYVSDDEDSYLRKTD
jgi:hypothetical protein